MMVKDDRVKKIEGDKGFTAEISKDDIVKEYIKNNESDPTWKDKKHKDMNKEEKNEYTKYRAKLKLKDEDLKPEEFPEDYYDKVGTISEDDSAALIASTYNKARISMMDKGEIEKIEKDKKERNFISDYLAHHKIEDQEKLNYVIEHDEKFRTFLENTNRINSLYTGKHLESIKKEEKRVVEDLKVMAKKDKKRKVWKKWKDKKRPSTTFEDSIKDLDLTPYRNKKMEAQGNVLTMYLQKNGLASLRYVKMDEVGQIKIDGYVYHERNAVWRFGKKNDPLLLIMEGSLVPINKETMKDNLGMETAEAQKLMIKGIEHAEVVKSGNLDDSANKVKGPGKWAIGIGIAVIIGVYVFMGGFGG